MKGYKGFHKGMICRGKQYAENTVFEEPEANICENGMHFCKEPIDVLDYYGFVDDNGELNEFSEVEALDEVHTDDEEKYCTTKLKIGAKLSFAGFVKACIECVLKRTSFDKTDSGNYAQIGSSGDNCVICCAGHNSWVKAKKGSWITLAEWEWNEEKEDYIPVCVKTEYVDGERIKEDVFYTIKDGEFQEVV